MGHWNDGYVGNQIMQVELSDGTNITDPLRLITDYYELDAHELYDKLEVAQDNRLDLSALSSLAFFEVFNPRLEHWRKLWDLRAEVEAILTRIPPNTELIGIDIPTHALVDIFEFFSIRVGGFGLARTSKVLHKKRPQLIPILDSLVAGHYSAAQNIVWDEKPRQGKVFGRAAVGAIMAIRNDIIANKETLVELQTQLSNKGLSLSLVRIFDIVVWEWEQSRRKQPTRH